MDKSYWSEALRQRVGRRRALTATGAFGAGAAFVAACGGGDSGSGGKSGSSLVAQPRETTSQVKRGGIMKDRAFADPSSLDILTPNNPITPWTNDVYNSLVQFEPGYLKPSENKIMNDLAESWETSADGLAITLKIRQGVKFHNKPPVNNRTLDMDDVLFSWQRFSTRSAGRVNLVNSVNPDAPVLSLTATDSRTVVIKLKEPLVYALNLFVPAGASGVYIVPKETDTSLDIRRDMLGTGPWYLDEYKPSVGVRLKRHADFWDKDWALVDQIDMPILSEYTAALSQFKAGNTYGSVSTNTAIRQEDVLFVKKEDPRVLLYQGDFATQAGFVQNFGWLPEGRSPFVDERVRQAVSMAIDRDLFIDTVSNVAPFRAEGLPVETRWNSHLNATTEGWWLDPKGKDFGPNAKYFKLDVAEAKKLLAAAGFPNGFETKSTIPGIEYPPGKYGEIIDGMVAEIGIKTKLNQVDYLTDYVPNFRDGKGKYEGWSYTSTQGGQSGNHAIGLLGIRFWSKGGGAFTGFSTNGKNDQSGDAQLNAMFEKVRVEPDVARQKAQVNDIQRYLAKANYGLNAPGVASLFLLAWPALQNFGVWQGARTHYRYWIDDTKPPFKKA